MYAIYMYMYRRHQYTSVYTESAPCPLLNALKFTSAGCHNCFRQAQLGTVGFYARLHKSLVGSHLLVLYVTAFLAQGCCSFWKTRDSKAHSRNKMWAPGN